MTGQTARNLLLLRPGVERKTSASLGVGVEGPLPLRGLGEAHAVPEPRQSKEAKGGEGARGVGQVDRVDNLFNVLNFHLKKT